ncbi:outer membrane beta-barrel protein [Vibrio methylphosphonaticus]|uniref:outer membrane beta-barrel protein n=1 Tax=Vibrio methylphosphonaticus TaxID=2946866 RepID=UPI00202A8FFF|nr:outer membrane beta-barrel protein [Vibrio methylphosphonaticus]MCL9774588.1 outer membrane beta-barrel protein [Vibrio methylphosphonaticus]
MKKIILATLFCSLGAYASESEDTSNNKMSLAIDYINSSNSFTRELGGQSYTESNNSNAFGLRLGFNKSNNGQWFIAYQNENFDIGIYDVNNNPLHYLSLGYNKEFPFSNGLAPYIRGSLGVGTMSVTGYSDSSATAIGGKVGAGLGYYVTDSFKISAGVDVQYRVWTPIKTTYGDIDINDSSFMATLGAEYYF